MIENKNASRSTKICVIMKKHGSGLFLTKLEKVFDKSVLRKTQSLVSHRWNTSLVRKTSKLYARTHKHPDFD